MALSNYDLKYLNFNIGFKTKVNYEILIKIKSKLNANKMH